MKYFAYIVMSIFYTSLSLLMVVLNPIHSLLLLINVFFLGTVLLFYLNVEFFGLVFFMVYIGAIVVLFLFVVMMLDIKISSVMQQKQDLFSYKSLLMFLILIEILFLFFENVSLTDYFMLNGFLSDKENATTLFTFYVDFYDFFKVLDYSTHLEILGRFLYKHYLYAFVLSGVLLYIAMVGAIVLTVEHSFFKTTKMQEASVQIMKQNIIRVRS